MVYANNGILKLTSKQIINVDNENDEFQTIEEIFSSIFSSRDTPDNSPIDLFINKVLNGYLFDLIDDCDTLIFDFSKSKNLFWDNFICMFFQTANEKFKYAIQHDDINDIESDFIKYYGNIPAWIKTIKIICSPYKNNINENVYEKDGSLCFFTHNMELDEKLNEFMCNTNGTKIIIDAHPDDHETFNKSC
jgi:hypothetical protein